MTLTIRDEFDAITGRLDTLESKATVADQEWRRLDNRINVTEAAPKLAGGSWPEMAQALSSRIDAIEAEDAQIERKIVENHNGTHGRIDTLASSSQAHYERLEAIDLQAGLADQDRQKLDERIDEIARKAEEPEWFASVDENLRMREGRLCEVEGRLDALNNEIQTTEAARQATAQRVGACENSFAAYDHAIKQVEELAGGHETDLRRTNGRLDAIESGDETVESRLTDLYERTQAASERVSAVDLLDARLASLEHTIAKPGEVDDLRAKINRVNARVSNAIVNQGNVNSLAERRITALEPSEKPAVDQSPSYQPSGAAWGDLGLILFGFALGLVGCAILFFGVIR